MHNLILCKQYFMIIINIDFFFEICYHFNKLDLFWLFKMINYIGHISKKELHIDLLLLIKIYKYF